MCDDLYVEFILCRCIIDELDAIVFEGIKGLTTHTYINKIYRNLFAPSFVYLESTKWGLCNTIDTCNVN